MGNGKQDSTSNITTGLLPNYLSVSGKTRQNDLDVGFTISINPGASTQNALDVHDHQENRQAFLTFGDASWGSIKLGRDLGIYASDAILNDMTLLGVGSGAGDLAGGTTTLGRIGTGYVYADWKTQAAYTSPNWNGFQFTAGVTQGWNAIDTIGGIPSAISNQRGGAQPAFEGKVSYEWTGDVAGKVWASAISQKVEGLTPADRSQTSRAFDIGGTVNVAGFGLTAYYNDGKGIGQTIQFNNAFDVTGKRRDSRDWYTQATYTIPDVGTKLGVAYGQSKLDGNSVDGFKDVTNSMWTIGAYHPLTKHLNLVAEYSEAKYDTDNRAIADVDYKAKTVSLGAILFF